MEFEFEQGNENILSTLALALYKDNSICIAWNGEPMSTATAVQVLAKAIGHTIAAKKDRTFVDRRDEAHAIIRLFAEAMEAEPTASIWRKADDELPKARTELMFTLRHDKSKLVYYGHFEPNQNEFIAESNSEERLAANVEFAPDEVAYWAFAPVRPIEDDKELDEFPSFRC